MKRRSLHLNFGIILHAVLFSFVLAFPVMGEPPAGQKWKLVWADEFDGTTLDRSKWDYREDWGGGSQRVKEGVTLDGKGNLVMRAWQDANGKCFAGAITTYNKFRHRYGYYELRCILPQKKGHWASYWFQTPQQGVPPYSPHVVGAEVDVFEYFDVETNVISQNIHWGCGGDFYEHRGHETEFPGLKEKKFHTFGLLWTPTEYVFTIDGRVTWRTREGVSHHDLYVILSEELEPGIWKGRVADDYKFKEDFLIIDYIRVYDLEDELAPPADKKGDFLQMVEILTSDEGAELLRNGVTENLSKVIHMPETQVRQLPLMDFRENGDLGPFKIRDNQVFDSLAFDVLVPQLLPFMGDTRQLGSEASDGVPWETFDVVLGRRETLKAEYKGNDRGIVNLFRLRAEMKRRVGWTAEGEGGKKPIVRYKRGQAAGQVFNPQTWYILSETVETVEVNGKPEQKKALVLYRLFTSDRPVKKKVPILQP